MVRCLNLLTPDCLWATGLLGSASSDNSDKVLIETVSKGGSKAEAHSLTLNVRATTFEACRKLFLLVLDAMEGLLGEWPNLSFNRLAVDTTYEPTSVSIELRSLDLPPLSPAADKEKTTEKPKSREKKESRDEGPTRIPIIELEKAVLEGRKEYFGTTYCSTAS